MLRRLARPLLGATFIASGADALRDGERRRRQAQRSLLVRDLGLLGGLLVTVADTGGRESVPHRAARTARKAKNKAAEQLP